MVGVPTLPQPLIFCAQHFVVEIAAVNAVIDINGGRLDLIMGGLLVFFFISLVSRYLEVADSQE